MKRIRSIPYVLFIFLFILSGMPLGVSAASAPSIRTEKTEYFPADTVYVHYEGTDSYDWIGVYPEGADPGSMTSLVWEYAVGTGTVTFAASSFGIPGKYSIYLCDNDGYDVLDTLSVTILDSENDRTDYGAKAATVSATMDKGWSQTSATIVPGSDKALTYELYWSTGGKRLEGYSPIATVTHTGCDSFTVDLNDCLFMPDQADGIEVFVVQGSSTPCYASAPDILKVPESQYLFEFQVISDTHISSSSPLNSAHWITALQDMAALSPNSSAIFCVGDNTDLGTQAEYDLLLKNIEEAGVELPPMYYAIGGHDVYTNAYDQEIERFLENLKMESVYYCVDIHGIRFIVLGSDSKVPEGELGTEQLNWLRERLAETDKSKPVFIFHHQPLKETVSGTLYSSDPEIQDWFGLLNSGDELREILSEYPNAIMFSGHTHWAFEMKQPLLYGQGKDATFVNTAAVSYLWSDDDTAVDGSEGYYVEVYEDYILLKGREYTNGDWCAAAQFRIPLNNVDNPITDGSQTTSEPTSETTHPQTENTSPSVTETTTNDHRKQWIPASHPTFYRQRLSRRV